MEVQNEGRTMRFIRDIEENYREIFSSNPSLYMLTRGEFACCLLGNMPADIERICMARREQKVASRAASKAVIKGLMSLTPHEMVPALNAIKSIRT